MSIRGWQRGGAHTQGSRVRVRSELKEWDGGRKKRERKRKLSVRKEWWKLTAETKHL